MTKTTQTRTPLTRMLSHSLLLIALVSMLSACGRTIEWKQEVRLHDGRVVLLARKSKQTDITLPEKQTIEPWQILTFKNPNTPESISFELPKGLRIWMLDFEGRFIYAVLKPASVADYNTWGCPNPPWMAYQYIDNHWAQIPLEKLPAAFVRPNVLPAAASDKSISADGLVTPTEFENFLNSSHKSLRNISREKVNPIAKGCFDDVLIQQGRQSEIDHRR